MSKKYSVVFFIVSFIIVVASSGIKKSDERAKAEHIWNYNVQSIQQLITDSPLIILGEVNEKKMSIRDNKIKYTASQVKVKEILKGNILPQDNYINIMQQNNKQDPVVKAGEEVILFLYPYGGTQVKEGYACVGLGQGYYRIKENRAEPAIPGSPSLNIDIEGQRAIVNYIKLQGAQLR